MKFQFEDLSFHHFFTLLSVQGIILFLQYAEFLDLHGPIILKKGCVCPDYVIFVPIVHILTRINSD